MAVLSELAQTQQSTSVQGAGVGAASSAGGTQIKATQQIDNTAALTRDIGKMFGNVLQTHQEASAYTGQRVGTDNLVEYKKEMSDIALKYDKPDLKSAELASKDIEEQGAYEKYMQKGVFHNNDIANQAFKDTYGIPATNDLLKNKELNNKIRNKLFTTEEATAVKEEMTLTSGVYTMDNIRVWQNRIRAVGLDSQLVFGEASVGLNSAFTDKFKDGAHSVALKAYLNEDGKLTQDGLDKVFTDVYGVLAKRENGEFSKANPDMNDKDYESLKKSFASWLETMNKEGNIKVMQTVSITNSSTKNTDSSDSIISKLNSAVSQVSDLRSVLDLDPSATNVSQYTTALQNVQELEMKANQSMTFERVYNSYLQGNYDKLVDTEYTYNVYNPNLSKTISGDTVKAQQIADYIGEKAFNDYNTAIAQGDGAKAASLIYSLGRLRVSGYQVKEEKIISGLFKDEQATSEKLNQSKTIGEFSAILDSSIGYKNVSGIDAPHISKNITDSTLNYYNERKAFASSGGLDSNGKPLTEQEILSETKMFYKIEARRITSDLKENQRVKAGVILGLTPKESMGDEMDKFVNGEVFGAKIGESEFAGGALNSMIKEAIENGASTREQLGKSLKSRGVVFDKSYLPFFGTSLVMANPTSLSAGKFRENVKDLVTYNIGQYQSVKNISFGDVVDSSNISFVQERVYVGGAKNSTEYMTTVHIKDTSGRILHSVLLTPEDIEAGVPSSEKQKFKSKFESSQKPKPYGAEDINSMMF